MESTTPREWNNTDEHLEDTAAIDKVRALLPNFRSTIMVTRNATGRELHMRPMGLQGDPATFGGRLWFFTDDRSRKVKDLEGNPDVSLVFQSDADSCYLQLDGVASVVHDPTKMRELYTALLKTWFPDGLEDPHLTLIRFDATGGAFWESPGGALQVLAAFTKAVVTGTPGKGGRSGTIEL